jgi:polyisoprenoid-binding protein YceI
MKNFAVRRPAFVVALLALCLAAAPALRAQNDWKIDPAHSSVGFDITHLGVATIHGTFTKTEGTVNWDDANMSKSSVKATIDVNSLDTGVAPRDTKVKSDSFFDAVKFPTMTFDSTSVQKSGDGLTVAGNLTIKGVTKPVTLNVTNISPAMPHPMKKGAMVRGLTATTTISRKNFGLAWTGPAAGVDAAVGDQLKITIQLEMDK